MCNQCWNSEGSWARHMWMNIMEYSTIAKKNSMFSHKGILKGVDQQVHQSNTSVWPDSDTSYWGKGVDSGRG
jgi:hypothetical protein